eukprot:TRINITY_DN652_c0_g2_i1.p2 TRINITY_DN652_c0_g2~~TRINITY_DN652_c0_g2_i1.p2  ORF type:complete len:82 (+),score=4.86 TRINITY_DN652_c0_g2_i1:605-850(+)
MVSLSLDPPTFGSLHKPALREPLIMAHTENPAGTSRNEHLAHAGPSQNEFFYIYGNTSGCHGTKTTKNLCRRSARLQSLVN